MEEQKCEECSSWAEKMYWTHFQYMHFCQILDGDFHTQLMIPEKFSDNIRGRLQETITLKGPSGTATWQVKLKANDDVLILKDGWREFLNAFSVEKDDILIFKYNGNSCFHVLIFDRKSLCEKESSYFIRKCGHSELGKTDQDRKFVKESPEEVLQEYSHEDLELIPLKKHRGENYREKAVALEEQSTLGNTDVNNLKVPCADASAVKEEPRSQKTSWTWETVKLPPVAEKIKLATKEPNADIVTYISKRRPVTEEEKKKALFMAREELTEDSFLVVLRPSHVYRKFFLTLAAEWIARNLMIYEKQAVRLRANDKTWPARLIFSSKGRGGLSYGWKEFSLENGLEEFDVCVLKLASQKHEPVLLNVRIFRVVPEVVKPIRVSPASTKNSSSRLQKFRHK